MEQPPKRSELYALGQMAMDHWSRFCPQRWQMLRESGQLRTALIEAQTEAENYIESAMARGIPRQEATEVALATWIHLPDLDEDSDHQAMLASDEPDEEELEEMSSLDLTINPVMAWLMDVKREKEREAKKQAAQATPPASRPTEKPDE